MMGAQHANNTDFGASSANYYRHIKALEQIAPRIWQNVFH